MKFNISRLYDAEDAKSHLAISVTALVRITDFTKTDELLELVPEESKEDMRKFLTDWTKLSTEYLGDQPAFRRKVRALVNEHEDVFRVAEAAAAADAAERKAQAARTKALLAKAERDRKAKKRARLQETSKYNRLMEQLQLAEKALEDPTDVAGVSAALGQIRDIVESSKNSLGQQY